MIALRLLPVLLSAILLGAHFFRMGSSHLVVLSLLTPAVLLIMRPWAARLVQFALIAGTVEWIRTLVVLVSDRQAEGEPWFRLAIIIGLVALLTASSAFLLSSSSKLRLRYGLDSRTDG